MFSISTLCVPCLFLPLFQHPLRVCHTRHDIALHDAAVHGVSQNHVDFPFEFFLLNLNFILTFTFTFTFIRMFYA